MGFTEEFQSDGTIKIVLPNDLYSKRNDTLVKVKAIAFSGSSGFHNDHPSVMAERFRNVEDFCRFVSEGVITGFNGVMFFLLENGHTLQAAMRRHENGLLKTHAKGYLASTGSGSSAITHHLENLFKAGTVTAREVFHYSCILDNSSNFDSYSVYGLEEDHLYGTVKVSRDEAFAAYEKIHGHVSKWNTERLENAYKVKS